MKKLRNNKGITLVALVVTIIILLILAAVSLSSVFNERGIFKRAETSATEHRAGTVEDEVTVWKNEKQIAKYDRGTVATRAEIIESQRTRGLLTDTEAETAKATGKVKIGTKTIDYGEDIISPEDLAKNPDDYKHPDQSDTNGDRAIGTDGKPVNMDLWKYEIIDENNKYITLSENTRMYVNTRVLRGFYS